jgi:hypothetical protein
MGKISPLSQHQAFSEWGAGQDDFRTTLDRQPPVIPPLIAAPQQQDESNLPQPAGPGLVTMYDTHQRSKYLTQIKGISATSVEEIEAARLRGDLPAAERAAHYASDMRNQIRTETQGRLLPGGRVMSGALEGDRSWPTIIDKYSGGNAPSFDTYQTIAKGAGRSRGSVTTLTKIGKVGGPVATVVGAGVAAHEIANAPAQERGRVASRETGGVLLGAAGATLGSAAAVAGMGLLVSNPVGWAVIGVGLAGAAIGGFIGSEAGKKAGQWLHDLF